MTKKYTLTTSEETVTENPEDIIRLMKLAGLENAQPVAEEEVTEEVEAEVYEPTEANDDLDLDDYSKKSPESIAKQKKSIQPTLGDNPLEYSLDENEIQEALMKEFDEDEKLAEERTDEVLPLVPLAVGGIARAVAGAVGKAVLKNPVKTAVASTMLGGGDEPVNASKKKKGEKLNAVKEETEETEEVTEAQSPAQKAAFEKMLAAKNGKKDDTVEEKEETTEEKVEETKKLKEDCDCGHGSDCDCDSDCDCGCNAVNEERVDEDESVTDGTLKALQHLVDSEYDDIGNADGSIAGGDMFGFHGSPYTAEEWAEYAKYQIDEIFTKHGSSVPPEIAKVYNGLVAYSKETELQAERRKNTKDSSPNAAPYYPENEDEMYIRDNFAEQWRHAFFKVVDRLGIEEAVNEDQDRIRKLINY